MSKLKELWDKIMPLPIGTQVRYIKNSCKLEFKHQDWFKAREKNIGNVGTVMLIFSPNDSEYLRFDYYFNNLKNKNLYFIRFDKPIGNYLNYYCLREELEII